jgi:hypothetical protein
VARPHERPHPRPRPAPHLRLTLPGLRPEKVASLGSIDPNAPSQGPWMGLDPDDAPLVLRKVGMWDVYVLDWEAP